MTNQLHRAKDARRITTLSNLRTLHSASETGPWVEFSGRNDNGTEVKITVRLEWWAWPMLRRQMAEAWRVQRALRMAEIATIDATLKQEDAA